MNRIDRLFGILLMLRTKRRLRAEELAERFQISKRTVYRDVAALHEIGVPVVSLPGEGYELMEGYYLPPLVFNHEEASSLFLGTHLLIDQATGALPDHAEQALTKIKAVMSETSFAKIEELVRIIRFTTPAERFDLDDPKVVCLMESILKKRVVRILYHSYNSQEVVTRHVEPYWFDYYHSTWYMNGYCRLRQGIRQFRLDRIDEIVKTDQYFSEFHQEEPPPAKRITIRLGFAPSASRWVKERQHYAFVRDETCPETGKVISIYEPETFGEMIHWIRSWGASVESVQPPELHEQICNDAKKLLEQLT